MALVADTSALVAIIFGEPDARSFSAALATSAGDVTISAATLLEARIVVESRQGPDAARDLDLLLDKVAAVVVAVDEAQISLATHAWRRFGKGRHAAGLNFGDCFSYALSKQLGVPLLFKGEDFRQTDVSAAI